MAVDPGYAEVLKVQAEKAFVQLLDNLPYNRTSAFMRIHLENSKCDLYIPIRENIVEHAEKAKDFYQDLANAAEL